jgi:photosystem II stability/assembly factor-like uncharacterized protein
MKGEFTRLTFRPQRHYTGVRLQQGRVQLDADFNEQVDIGTHRDQVTTRDVIGPAGAPDDAAGFAVTPTVQIAALALAGGVQRAAGGRGTLLSGAAWTAQDAPTDADLLGLAARDGVKAIAVGAGGTVLGTTDGALWTALALPGGADPDLHGVAWTGDSEAWSVGEAGAIFSTDDDGATWTEHPVAGVAETLRAIAAPAAGGAWAAGEVGRILTLTAAGWEPQVSGTARTLRGIAFADATTGWAVGDDATILSTDDGGATWTAQAAPAGVATSLRSVAAEDADRAWAVGAGGTVLHTTDAGVTWTLVDPDPSLATADLLTVVALGGDAALVAGDPWALAQVDVAAAGAPVWTLVAPPAEGHDLLIGAGRLYVDGVPCENEQPVRYGEQRDLPDAPFPAAGRHLAYLDVWQRHLTAVERQELREVALGGPDTATRTQTVWQVRLADLAAGEGCEAVVPGSDSPGTSSTGRLRAQASPEPLAVDDCMVAAGGGYRRLENQLYRVEIHAPGFPGAATYKWSRDNGAILARLVDSAPGAMPQPTISVAVAGRDAAEAFADARYVELSDEDRVLRGEPGIVLEVHSVHGDVISLVDPPPALDALGTSPTVRRWEDTGGVDAGGWIALEDGVEIQFSAGEHRTGDWWSVPARTLQGAVEWPQEDGAPSFQPRHGIDHRACPLAVVEVDANGAFSVETDCRPLFTPLVAQTHAFLAGGDGQDVVAPAAGEAQVPRPLEVGVMNGRRAIDGAWVRFTVVDGASALGPGHANPVEVRTVDGIAATDWFLNAGALHRVEARLLDGEAGLPVGAPLHFNATRRAPETGGGNGGACTVVVRPGDDLAEAIAKLPETGGELCLGAGVWDIDEPLRLTGRHRVTITGRGPSTVLRGGHEVVVLVRDCSSVTVRNLRIEAGGMGSAPGEQHLLGALTFVGCVEVRVIDCELTCPDTVARRAQSCLAVHGSGQAAMGMVGPPPRERTVVERNRFEVGANQVGALLVDVRSAYVAANHVTLGHPDRDRPGWLVQGAIGDVMLWMLEAVRPRDEGDVMVIADRDVFLTPDHPTLELWKRFAEWATDVVLKELGALGMLRRYFEEVAEGGLGEEERELLIAAAEHLRCAGQGIVVGGDPESVQILDNVVDGTIQGIHVGASRDGKSTAQAQDVTVARNVVRSRVPNSHRRERHAVLVANAELATVTDTTATLERVGGPGSLEAHKGDAGRTLFSPAKDAIPTPVDAIRVMGEMGPYIMVRGSALKAFGVGVRVMPSTSDAFVEDRVLWVVRETLAWFSGTAVAAHPAVRHDPDEQLNLGRP